VIGQASRHTRVPLVLALVVGGYLLVAGAASEARSATSVRVTVTGKTHRTGPASFSGTFKGKPWGKGRVTGTVNIPYEAFIFHLKGGTATARTTGKLQGQNVVGTFKWIKGTGAYKRIKGKGTFTQNLTTAVYRIAGRATY
jgi:hypothetical protein